MIRTVSRPLVRSIAAVALIAGLASCGGSDDDSTDTTAATTVEATAETTVETDATGAPSDSTEAPSESTEAPSESSEAPSESSEASSGDTQGTSITVSLTEWDLELDGEVQAGPVNFTINNDGTFPHELVIMKADSYESLPKKSSGEIIEDELPEGTIIERVERFEGGQSEELSTDLEAGKYVFVCNLAVGPNSHAGKGQVLDVTVS